MSNATTSTAAGGLEGINPNRLFLGSCMSLIATSVAFGAITSLMGDFKTVFALTNTEAGWIGGATLWGFTISIFAFGPLVDFLGMGRLMRFSMLCHLLGPLMMIFADLGTKITPSGDFWMLFIGGLIIALGNGTVEAVCNPLVATIYPDRKTQKLNQFHVWFPGGIAIGALLSFFIDKIGLGGAHSWQIKIALVLVPAVLYGIIFTAQKFPHTERVQSGISFGGMVRATLLRPLFIILFICMSITASIELGPGRWMGEVMEGAVSKFAGANAGILVLVYGSILMAFLRFNAGVIIKRLSPTGLLVGSAVLAGAGLCLLTYVEGWLLVIAVTTVFYCGVCYFWPTLLGVVAERVPRGGALALALMGGWGMAVCGIVTVPLMGHISDVYGHEEIIKQEAVAIDVITQGATALNDVFVASGDQIPRGLEAGLSKVKEVNDLYAADKALPEVETAKALREIAKFAPEDNPIKETATTLLKPADDVGGKASFRWISSLSLFLIVVFGYLYLSDRAKGGYKAESIHDEA